jgi:hypothetical protein
VPAVVPRVPAGAAPRPHLHELLRRHHLPQSRRLLLLLLLKLTVQQCVFINGVHDFVK